MANDKNQVQPQDQKQPQAKVQKSKSDDRGSLSVALWIIAAVAAAAAVWMNYYFQQPDSIQPTEVRLPAVIGAIAIAFVCALLTNSGRSLIKFAKASKNEMRKVTWPTREETVKSTVGVGAVVAIVAFIIWAFDVIIGSLVSLITSA